MLADSAHIMKQLFANRCVVIYCFMRCCHPVQLLSREAGAVGRSTCSRNLASCRLVTSVGKYHRSRAMGSSSKWDLFLKHTWEEVILA